MKTILIIHGPNLNMLGKRDPQHYSTQSFDKLEEFIAQEAHKRDFTVNCFQSNHEGALIDFIQQHAPNAHAIIINPGAFTHYSYALHDALLDAQLPAVEVHLSDVENREDWRKISVTAPACIAKISGQQEQGYVEALEKIGELKV